MADVVMLERFPASVVLRTLGMRHAEQTDELEHLASTIERCASWPMTAARLRDLNCAWSRGAYWCQVFKADADPMNMPS